MRLVNDLCAVEIYNDTRYTLNSADNPHYELDFDGNLISSRIVQPRIVPPPVPGLLERIRAKLKSKRK